MADEKTDEKHAKERMAIPLNDIRTRLAQAVWFVCVAAALLLAVGALCIALKANQNNGLVEFVLDWADNVDLTVFSRENGVWEADPGKNAEIKNALVNWGLGAIVWLVLGRIADRVIRP